MSVRIAWRQSAGRLPNNLTDSGSNTHWSAQLATSRSDSLLVMTLKMSITGPRWSIMLDNSFDPAFALSSSTPARRPASSKAFPILESSSFGFTEPFQTPRRERSSKYLMKVSALAILAAKSSVLWALLSLFFSGFSGFSVFLPCPPDPALGTAAFFFAIGSFSFLSPALPAPVQPKKFSLESESEAGSASPSSSSGSGALPSASASSSYHECGTSAMQVFSKHVETNTWV